MPSGMNQFMEFGGVELSIRFELVPVGKKDLVQGGDVASLLIVKFNDRQITE
jgi:hypothetical protein